MKKTLKITDIKTNTEICRTFLSEAALYEFKTSQDIFYECAWKSAVSEGFVVTNNRHDYILEVIDEHKENKLN